MSEQQTMGNAVVRLIRDDLTAMDIEAFVFYAQEDLALGSGYGGAITVRGGPSIQEELKTLAPIDMTEAVVSQAGELKANYIIHAVGPKFREENWQEKLRATILNALKAAEEKGITRIAFPPMGTGFYGVPLDDCARIMLGCFADHLNGSSNVTEVIVCANDVRDFHAFKPHFAPVAQQEES